MDTEGERPEQDSEQAQREVDERIDELMREGDDMEGRLGDAEDAASGLDAPEEGEEAKPIDPRDIPEDDGEAANEAGQ